MILSLKSSVNFLLSEIRDRLKYRFNNKWQLSSLGVDRIYWGERGSGNVLLIKQLNKFYRIRNSYVLLQGIQGGNEIRDFFYYRPRMVVGCELFNYKETWNLLKEDLNQYNIPVYIIQNDIHSLCFPNESFDIIASFGVYEHVRNLDEILKENQRVLKANGIILATLGPLYFCFGGDHFSGHGGIENGYNHLLLSRDEYVKYFDKFSYQLGNQESGYRKYIIEEPLFSYLRFYEYITLFKKYFRINYLAIKVSKQAILFKKRFPEKFNWLQRDFALAPYDLIIKGIIVSLKKRCDVKN